MFLDIQYLSSIVQLLYTCITSAQVNDSGIFCANNDPMWRMPQYFSILFNVCACTGCWSFIDTYVSKSKHEQICLRGNGHLMTLVWYHFSRTKQPPVMSPMVGLSWNTYHREVTSKILIDLHSRSSSSSLFSSSFSSSSAHLNLFHWIFTPPGLVSVSQQRWAHIQRATGGTGHWNPFQGPTLPESDARDHRWVTTNDQLIAVHPTCIQCEVAETRGWWERPAGWCTVLCRSQAHAQFEMPKLAQTKLDCIHWSNMIQVPMVRKLKLQGALSFARVRHLLDFEAGRCPW